MQRFVGEPMLEDLLSDPIMVAVMQSDNVDPRDLCRLMREARNRQTTPAPAGHAR